MTVKLLKPADSADVFDLVETADADDVADGAAPEGEDDELAELDQLDDLDALESTAPGKVRGRRWLRYTAVIALAVMFFAAVAAAGFFGWQYKQHNEIDNAGRAALASAQDFVVALTTIETGAVDQDVERVIASSTGEFRDTYSQSASQLRQVLIDNKATSKGTVIDSAIKSVSKDRVDVVLFVDQWISNVTSPKPRMDRSRVSVTMTLVDGKWLTSNVELK